MKIIAKTEVGFLLSASEDEIAALSGFNSAYSDGFKRGEQKIGQEIPVSQAREAMQFVKAWAAERLVESEQAMKRMADHLAKIRAIFPTTK